MHRSNHTSFLLGILFLATLAAIWIWLQDFSETVNWWTGWSLTVYGTVAGFLVWEHGFRYKRLTQDVPTSLIATAAQGYVELYGTAAQFENQQAKQYAGQPVLWFRKQWAERVDASEFRAFPFNLFYTPVAIEESRTPFMIVDTTGNACILPHGADVIVSRKNVRFDDNKRVTEETILPGDQLYVLGDFSSHTPTFPYTEKLEQLLREWELNPIEQRKYDRNRDGRMNPAEWREMHLAAQMTVAAEQNDFTDPGQRHLVFLPGNGRRFIISTLSPAELAGHYHYHLIVGLMLLTLCIPVWSMMMLYRFM